MATKVGLSYYTVDTDRYLDIRIKRLRKDYGCRGLAVYDYVLCEVYRDRGCFLVWDESTAFDVAEYLGLKESVVQDIVKYCSVVGLFNEALLRRGIITSASIQKRYLEMATRAKRKAVTIPEICKLPEVRPQVREVGAQIRENSGSSPQNKEKKSKVNNYPNPPFEEGIRSLLVDDDSWTCNQQIREHLTKWGFEWQSEVPTPNRGDGITGRIDLTAIRGDEKYAIEIDRISPREKSIFKLKNFDNSFHKIVLLRGGTTDGLFDGIHVIPLKIKEKVARKRKDLDLSFVEPAFQPIMADWLAYKSERGQTYRQKGVEGCYSHLKTLSGNNPDVARRIVEQSIANNYAGLFPLKTTNNVRSTTNQPPSPNELAQAVASGIARAHTRQEWEQ